LVRTPTEFPSLVKRVIEQLTPRATSHQITIHLEPSPIPSATSHLSIDPMRIEQILSNLLSNALRFTPQGGQVILTLTSTPSTISLSVRDTGPGIPAEALPHIFERFYRADKSRSREEGGTGLGLAIARHLAEVHGGTLTAENHAEGGAIFTLTLPVENG
jgi:two-component system sensor histidine kinase BaeS